MKAAGKLKEFQKRYLRKANVITGLILGFILGSALVYAGSLTSSLITFYSGQTASASQVNTNFQLLADALDKNREGFACSINTPMLLPTSSVSPFTCETILAAYPSYSSGSALFVASQSGVYQIYKGLLLYGDTINPPGLHSGLMYSTINIGGSNVLNDRQVFFLTSGQSLNIFLFNPSAGTPTYLREGSLVYVKRLF